MSAKYFKKGNKACFLALPSTQQWVENVTKQTTVLRRSYCACDATLHVSIFNKHHQVYMKYMNKYWVTELKVNVNHEFTTKESVVQLQICAII
jgi:hypothetical protein